MAITPLDISLAAHPEQVKAWEDTIDDALVGTGRPLALKIFPMQRNEELQNLIQQDIDLLVRRYRAAGWTVLWSPTSMLDHYEEPGLVFTAPLND